MSLPCSIFWCLCILCLVEVLICFIHTHGMAWMKHDTLLSTDARNLRSHAETPRPAHEMDVFWAQNALLSISLLPVVLGLSLKPTNQFWEGLSIVVLEHFGGFGLHMGNSC